MKSIHLSLAILILAVTGCNKNDDSVSKGTGTNSDFDQLYMNYASSSAYKDERKMDAEVHAYTFQVSRAHTIYQIGYQSEPAISTTPYLMEIYDSTSARLLYSGAHTFSPTATSYVSIAPVAVMPGHKYIVRRIQTNWGSILSNAIGRILDYKTPSRAAARSIFPTTVGDLTVSGSIFYGKAGPIYELGLPYIDLKYN